MERRTFFQSSVAIAGLGCLSIGSHAQDSREIKLEEKRLNRKASAPSDLRITDLRVASLKQFPHNSTIIRIDTNQGISGWGEVRDGASPTYALMLKSRLLGENPCDVDRLFRKIKQLGTHGRAAGGVSGVEMALWDLAGKAFEVPVYQLLGGKFRDKIRVYADTRQTSSQKSGELPLSGKQAGEVLRERMKKGFTWLKCDIGIGLLEGYSGCTSRPLPVVDSPNTFSATLSSGVEVTPKGIEMLAGYISDIRSIIGMEVPLAIDHLGPISVNSAIRLAKALEPFSLAWIEDPIPWKFVEQLHEISIASTTPILTGEDIYLKEDFNYLTKAGAVDILHPDLGSSGGILETKKIADYASERGVPVAIHCSSSPIQFFASVHCAAAIENFLCLEHHGVDIPDWDSLALGLDKPIVIDGFVELPNRPGIGFELNEEVARKHAGKYGFFEPTPEWDVEQSWDRTWS
jgi:L-alanine-DL-glutamate epimerase-like enolase superfamily enzyme